MATVKAVSSRASVSRVLDYVTKEEKTDLRLMTGFDCSPGNVKGEMQATKELWGKADGRTYLHFVQSWHEDEKITPELAHRIGCELTKQLRAEGQPWHGFEVLMVTHVDRGHIHNHIVTNSVSMEDGKKIQFSPKDLQAMKDRSDELCQRFGLSICEKGKSFHGEDLTLEQPSTYSKEAQYIMDQAKAGKVDSYIMEIAKAAAEVRSTATSREDFCQQMSDRGYSVNWSDSRKNITFTDLARELHGEKKCKVRDSNLEKTFPALEFSKDSFILAFEDNVKAKAQDLATEQKDEVIREVYSRIDDMRRKGWENTKFKAMVDGVIEEGRIPVVYHDGQRFRVIAFWTPALALERLKQTTWDIPVGFGYQSQTARTGNTEQEEERTREKYVPKEEKPKKPVQQPKTEEPPAATVQQPTLIPEEPPKKRKPSLDSTISAAREKTLEEYSAEIARRKAAQAQKPETRQPSKKKDELEH